MSLRHTYWTFLRCSASGMTHPFPTIPLTGIFQLSQVLVWLTSRLNTRWLPCPIQVARCADLIWWIFPSGRTTISKEMAIFATLETGLAKSASTSDFWFQGLPNRRASSCSHDCISVSSTASLPSTTGKKICACNLPSTQVYVTCAMLKSLTLFLMILKFHRKLWWWHQRVQINIDGLLWLPSCFWFGISIVFK